MALTKRTGFRVRDTCYPRMIVDQKRVFVVTIDDSRDGLYAFTLC